MFGLNALFEIPLYDLAHGSVQSRWAAFHSHTTLSCPSTLNGLTIHLYLKDKVLSILQGLLKSQFLYHVYLCLSREN